MHDDLPPQRILRRRDLARFSDRALDRLLREGALVRARKGIYLRADAEPDTVAAVRAGGRVACVSALAQGGVFVHGGMLDLRGPRRRVHVHLAKNASRLGPGADAARLHWMPLARQPDPADPCVDVVDALAQSAACQSPRAFLASVDSALNSGRLHPDDVAEVFAALPRRMRRLRPLLDGRAESGTETLVRLMLRGLGVQPRLQVVIDGVGRVDLVVGDWLVIECDSRGFHAGWAEIRRDRRRDQSLAALGYVVYRPIAEDILFHPEVVLAALKGLLAGRRARGRGAAFSG